jgi:hypothetical protein
MRIVLLTEEQCREIKIASQVVRLEYTEEIHDLKTDSGKRDYLRYKDSLWAAIQRKLGIRAIG